MNRWEIILGIVFGLIVNEITDVSPWLARRLVRWSAYRWTTNLELAETYAEEWAAVVDERPGKLFKLLTALRFALEAVGRTAPRDIANLSKRIRLYLSFAKEYILELLPITIRVMISRQCREEIELLADYLAKRQKGVIPGETFGSLQPQMFIRKDVAKFLSKRTLKAKDD